MDEAPGILGNNVWVIKGAGGKTENQYRYRFQIVLNPLLIRNPLQLLK